MSQCFPYPPPGYTPSRAKKEALIESIKLQKELEKTKAQSKQEKRRRMKEDERTKRKDEKNEIRKPTDGKTDPISKKRRKREEGREEKKRRRKERNQNPDMNSNKVGLLNIGKNIWENSEQRERSGLTEEHGQPLCLHLPSTSFESTENSGTRKRQSSPVNVIQRHGTIIRIRLSSKKQNLSDISVNEQQLCSTSGRTDIPPRRNWKQNFCASTEKTSDFVLGDFNTYEKQIISTSGKSQPTAPAKAGTPSVLDAIEVSKKSSKTMQYTNLIVNWVPPSRHDAPSSPEDLDWLFCSKDHGLLPERRQKVENDGVFCSSSSSLLQPRAHFLPEFDVYALPFTVPY